MLRSFETHTVRPYRELDGNWQFVCEKYPERIYTMYVPSCWEMHADLARYRGRGVYTKTFRAERDGNLRLVFGGVSHTADVYLDGEKIAHHYNAFTEFDATVPQVSAGLHTLEVHVDNRFSEASALHKSNDYYTYGGITRPVELSVVPDLFVKGVHFTPSFADGIWSARLDVFLQNMGRESVTNDLCVCLAEETVSFGSVTVAAGETMVFTREVSFSKITPWSPKCPQLYFLRAVLSQDGNETDDLIDRVGFRTSEVVGNEIRINGEAVKIMGFNRHEDHALFGCAIPPQMMEKDLDLMVGMGANSVRTCHYPNDPRFLDLCDERGILVWEENHARGLYLPDMQNPNFERQCKDCIDEMIFAHYNHPAIYIWGILNECASDTEEGRDMYFRQFDQIRSLDTSRPLTSATFHHFKDLCFSKQDVISVNCYFGWYDDKTVEGGFAQEYEWLSTDPDAKGKPIIISECGAAGLYGYRDPSGLKWSEERQAEILRETLEHYLSHPAITGVYIWQFCDCRVTEESYWFQTRVRMHNNKGVVDEYRRPKLSCAEVRAAFTKYAK